MMSFVFGLAIGIPLGCLAMHSVHSYLDRMLPVNEKDEEEK